MQRTPSGETLAVWKRLMQAGSAVDGAVQAALKEAGLPPLDWYEVMVEIDRAGKDGIRPFELTETLRMPQYGLSRLLARMEKAGLVARRLLKGDARGHVISLTQDGLGVKERMRPVMGDALQRAIGDRLEITEALRLGQYLQRLANLP